MISIRGVSKRFGTRLAVEDLTLTVPRGVIFGLLGHNGAGKSTTIGMLLAQVMPDAGELEINGCDVFADRARALARVGAIFETPAFYDYLSGWRNLRIFCEYTAPASEERMRDVVHLVGLDARIHDRVSAYSHGMRQRLALAQALLPGPELLILDEPSEGLDPEGIHEMRNLILRLNAEWGLTILFSSHLLSEVQQLCSNLAVMREGRLLFAGDWRLINTHRQWLCVRVDRQAEAERALLEAGLVDEVQYDGRARLATGADVPWVAEWLVAQGFRVEAIRPIERTLEDFYLETVHGRDPVSAASRPAAETAATTPNGDAR
ncbi:MAG: ABC transporter ATP-binding protein [Verrucomicrobia bacterium]|nr:ABC transporter ATP-binding protein [Verrucomicrobiota bacterium]